MLRDYLWVIVLAMSPVLEVRASIPYGILVGLSDILVLALSIVFNALTGIVLFCLCRAVALPQFEFKARHKLQQTIHKYGKYGLIVFVAVPVPGTGVYSAALAAHLIGMNLREYTFGMILGVIFASLAVFAVTQFFGMML